MLTAFFDKIWNQQLALSDIKTTSEITNPVNNKAPDNIDNVDAAAAAAADDDITVLCHSFVANDDDDVPTNLHTVINTLNDTNNDTTGNHDDALNTKLKRLIPTTNNHNNHIRTIDHNGNNNTNNCRICFRSFY